MLLWDSFIGGAQSLGVVGERTVVALARSGETVLVRPWNLSLTLKRRWFLSEDAAKRAGYAWGDDALRLMHPEARELVLKGRGGISIDDEQRSVALTWGPLDRLSDTYWRYSRLNVGYTFCDYTFVSPAEREACGRLDAVFVPSAFSRQALVNSGVSVPVHVWPHGVWVDGDDPVQDTDSAQEDVITFLFAGVAQERKGISELLDAFTLAFPPEVKDVRLIVKSADWGRLERWAALFPDGRITWLHALFDRAQMNRLYRSVSCLVMPTRAESFCLPLLEAMAAGVPVMYTDHGGHLDFCSPEVGYPIPVSRLAPALSAVDIRSRRFARPPEWAIPDVAALVELMRDVYRNPEAARMKGRRGAQVAQAWTWEAGAERAIQLLRELA